MTLIRLRTIVAGPEFEAQPGQVVDWPGHRAQALIDGGFAEVVETGAESISDEAEAAAIESVPDEVADEPEGETAVTRARRGTRQARTEAGSE